MTPQPQQQEYIIDGYTADEIERLLNMPEHAMDDSDYDAMKLAIKLLRSRPAPNPGTGDTRQQEYIITEIQLKRILVLMNRDSVMDEEEFLDIAAELRSRPAASQPTSGPKFNSADLLLLAHDEWKRREERKHIHDMRDWEAGFINGFLTDKKWARELLDKMYADATLRSHSTTGTADKGGE